LIRDAPDRFESRVDAGHRNAKLGIGHGHRPSLFRHWGDTFIEIAMRTTSRERESARVLRRERSQPKK